MAKTPLYLYIRDRIRADYHITEVDSPRRLPTERELQERYGASRPTIAKALAALAADGRLVSTQGRGRFLLPYPTSGGASSSGKRIGYVASIATEILTQRTLFGIEREAGRRGYRVVMANANNRPEQERDAVRDLIGSGVAGLIIYPVPRPDDGSFTDYLEAQDLGVPVVLVDTSVDTQPHPQFLFDNEQLGYDVASWLIHHGHRTLAYAVGDIGIVHRPLQERIKGVQRAAKAAGLSDAQFLIIRYDAGREGALCQVARKIIESTPRPTAVLATEDRAAAELMDVFTQAGIRVGQDITVVGFDAVLDQRRHRYHWMTTRPDFAKLGEKACARLLDIIEGAPARQSLHYLEVPFLTRRPHELRQRSEAAVDAQSLTEAVS